MSDSARDTLSPADSGPDLIFGGRYLDCTAAAEPVSVGIRPPPAPAASSARSARRSIPGLSPKYQDSPYLENPLPPHDVLPRIAPSGPGYGPWEPDESGRLAPATPRRYKRIGNPHLPYAERSRFMAVREAEFFSDIRTATRHKFACSHYCLDMNEYRNSGIRRAVSARKAFDKADRASRRADVRARQRAADEAKGHDLFHLDEIYNPRYPALRVIPLNDRRNRARGAEYVFL
jgi:hypothetical protein